MVIHGDDALVVDTADLHLVDERTNNWDQKGAWGGNQNIGWCLSTEEHDQDVLGYYQLDGTLNKCYNQLYFEPSGVVNTGGFY